MLTTRTEFIRTQRLTATSAAMRLLPEALARELGVAPLWLEGDKLVVASNRPDDPPALFALKQIVRSPVRALWAPYPEIRTLLDRSYQRQMSEPPVLDLGSILLRLGHLTHEQLDRATAAQAEHGESLAQVCARLGLCKPEDLLEAQGWQESIPHLVLQGLTPQTALAALLPWTSARERHVVPLWLLGHTLIVGTDRANGALAVADLELQIGLNVLPVACSPGEFNTLYEHMYLTGITPNDDHALVVQTLVQQGALSTDNLKLVTTVAQQTRQPVSQILLDRRVVTPQQWLAAQSQVFGIPVYRGPAESNFDGAEWIPAPIARALALVPLQLDSRRKQLTVGVLRRNDAGLQIVHTLTGLEVEPRLIDPATWRARLDRLVAAQPKHATTPFPSMEQLLVNLGMVTVDQMAQATGGEALADDELRDRLLESDLVDETDWYQVLGVRTGLPFVRLDNALLDQALVRQILPRLLTKYTMIPLYRQGGDLWLAVSDPSCGAGLQAVEQTTGWRVWTVLAPRSVIAAVLHRFFDEHLHAMDAPVHELLAHLVERGMLTQSGAARAIDLIAQGVPPDRAIVESSAQPAAAVVQALAAYAQVPLINLQLWEETAGRYDALGQAVVATLVHDPVDPAVARLIDHETALRLGALPVRRTGQLTVAFADPLFAAARVEIETLLGEAVRPCLVLRSDLDAAIQRLLGHQNIGTRLLLAGVITRAQLNDALEFAERTGVRLGRALVNRGYTTTTQLARFLAEQARLPFYSLTGVSLDDATARLINPVAERRFGILPLAADADQVTLGMVDPLNDEALQSAVTTTGRAVHPVLIGESDLEVALEQLYHDEYLGQSVSDLLLRSPEDSAYSVLSHGQKVALMVAGVISVLALTFALKPFLIFLSACSSFFYLAFSIYKFYLIYSALANDLEVPVTDQDLAALSDRDLPTYTILVPVYHEAAILPEVMRGLARLDYPTTKLDIKVLMEADDKETIAAFHNLQMPSQFEGVVVPAAQPRTKPKACNYGLIHARGEYVVIFDAEDLPDPDQLKRVLIAFAKSAPDVVCIQSKLNYYNRNQNLLTAWFTIEYSMWFDLFLPGLDASHAPIPLGGTSNHFKRGALVEAGAWDPHNVTEDADLGIRLFKRGYRTAVVDSTTYEEANCDLYNWIRQRSRWIKGYIQTWLVHMRHPVQLYRQIGGKAFWSFQFVVGGTFFSALMNPVYWFLTTFWFLTRWGFVQEIFPGPIFYAGAICLYVGNFAFLYTNVAGAMRREYYDIVRYALLSPLYWGLMSVAAWKGFWQLITKPHFWEKTQHGLSHAEPVVPSKP